ncbi:adenosine kinase [Palleronia aestuarii]|uniref:Adenosine kinase n=1 Tax=Palleronia aestuarii TaxID=568105 RepID=A0A2W7MVM5_9RHOB|nr:adenosine kinase [Palleronia aestuarii]
MRIAVLGPMPRDIIVTSGGQVHERYGGALYTSVALASLGAGIAAVHPVTRVSADEIDALLSLMSPFDAIVTSAISAAPDAGTGISLVYQDHNLRDETQVGRMPPIGPDDLRTLPDCEAYVVVPVTDHEVPLDTIRSLKARGSGTVVLDAHGATTGCATNGQRYRKSWTDRDAWLPHIDILKMNLEEARFALIEESIHRDLGPADLRRLAEACLTGGTEALYVTLDADGCVVFDRAMGRLRERVVHPVDPGQVIDTTGCGDSFAAGLALGHLLYEDHVRAAELGNYAGARRCSSRELAVYGSLADAEACIAATYRTPIKAAPSDMRSGRPRPHDR